MRFDCSLHGTCRIMQGHQKVIKSRSKICISCFPFQPLRLYLNRIICLLEDLKVIKHYATLFRKAKLKQWEKSKHYLTKKDQKWLGYVR